MLNLPHFWIPFDSMHDNRWEAEKEEEEGKEKEKEKGDKTKKEEKTKKKEEEEEKPKPPSVQKVEGLKYLPLTYSWS